MDTQTVVGGVSSNGVVCHIDDSVTCCYTSIPKFGQDVRVALGVFRKGGQDVSASLLLEYQEW